MFLRPFPLINVGRSKPSPPDVWSNGVKQKYLTRSIVTISLTKRSRVGREGKRKERGGKEGGRRWEEGGKKRGRRREIVKEGR